MMRIARLLIVPICLVAFLPGSFTAPPARATRLPQGSSCAPPTTARSGAFASLVRTQNAFGFRLFSALMGKTPSTNMFISPTSVSIALAMAYDGARGATSRSLADGLGLGGISQPAVRQQAAALLSHLQASGSNAGLSV